MYITRSIEGIEYSDNWKWKQLCCSQLILFWQIMPISDWFWQQVLCQNVITKWEKEVQIHFMLFFKFYEQSVESGILTNFQLTCNIFLFLNSEIYLHQLHKYPKQTKNANKHLKLCTKAIQLNSCLILPCRASHWNTGDNLFH